MQTENPSKQQAMTAESTNNQSPLLPSDLSPETSAPRKRPDSLGSFSEDRLLFFLPLASSWLHAGHTGAALLPTHQGRSGGCLNGQSWLWPVQFSCLVPTKDSQDRDSFSEKVGPAGMYLSSASSPPSDHFSIAPFPLRCPHPRHDHYFLPFQCPLPMTWTLPTHLPDTLAPIPSVNPFSVDWRKKSTTDLL